jgi:hypothetical protein
MAQHMTQSELSDFVITRLAELTVVVFRDHVGEDEAAMKARSEGRSTLVALGDLVSEHGRADLAPTLRGLGAKLEAVAQMLPEPEPHAETQLAPRSSSPRHH